MAQVLLRPRPPPLLRPSLTPAVRPPLPLYGAGDAIAGITNPRWSALREELKCEGRHSCFFADGRKKEQARKALESALGGKKKDLEKWNKEIEKRQEKGSGGASGRGGWFGGGGPFGWFSGEHFWEEARQAILAIIGIVSLYLLFAKGHVMFAVVFNSLLFVLRGSRNVFTLMSSSLLRRTFLPGYGPRPEPESSLPVNEVYKPRESAKERVVRKWGAE